VSSVIAPIRRRFRIAISLAVLAAALAPSSAFAAQHLGDRTLHKGDRGHDVRVLQDFLTRAGYATPIAGVFGPQTLHNVRRFQRAHHMTVDGVVGSGTSKALRTIAARRAHAQEHAQQQDDGGAAEHLGDRTLRKGMRGQDVRVLQDYLTRSGVSTPVDGVFGPGTARNVKRFQRAHNLTVDGVVGAGTEGLLRRVGDGGTAGDTGAPADAPVGHATLRADGTAVAPADAPQAVKDVIAAGNRIATKPYVYGGGHGTWNDNGYDCSGSVSYALHGGGLINTQLDSTSFESWGARGGGRWITVYANSGHAYMTVAGLRFDTSGASPSRWQSDMRSSSGYVVRHPSSF
jgi:peptidoglycan hydrolase-like protein with peptidoglycan-binding domain